MRDLFFKLFEMSHFDTGIKITAFSVPHIVYMVLIFGAIIGAWLCNNFLLMNTEVPTGSMADTSPSRVTMASRFPS